MTTYVQLALYPEPDEHFAYVKWVELEWPLQGAAYQVVCPADGCHLSGPLVYETFEQAWRVARQHRVALLEDWLQPGIPEA